MKRILLIVLMLLVLVSCSKQESFVSENKGVGMDKILKLKIDDEIVDVEWLDNESVDSIIELVNNEPLFINMSMYGGFEQVGSIGKSITRNDKQTSTSAGDIVLYSGNQIVIFYGSNSWAYTKLGKIINKDLEELKKLLGENDVVIELYLE